MKPRHHLFFATALVLAACADDVDEALDTGSSTDEPSTSGSPSTTMTSLSTTIDPDTTTDASSSTGPGTSSESGTTVDPDSSSSGSTGTDTGSSSESESSDSGSSDSGESSTGEPVEIIVVINELSSNNDGVDGADPIELYNASEGVADISGWIITDDVSEPYDPEVDDEELVFPEGTTLFPGEYLLFYRGEKGMAHPFGLSNDGDTVRLFDAELATVDTVTYAVGEAAVSYCRMPDGPEGIWTPDCAETFGASNG